MTDPALLLADPSPALRYRVLTELLDVAIDDPEVADLDQRRRSVPERRELLEATLTDVKATAWRLCRLAYLGLDRSHGGVSDLAEWLFTRQSRDGSWPLRVFSRTRD